MPEVTIGDLRIAYERAGDGPPLVLLHGLFGFDSRSWRRQLEALSDAYSVVAWDMPGTGHSSDPPDGFRDADFADSLAECMSALGLGRPHVLGLSFGAALALELYRRHSTVPRSLVLASAYAGWAGSLPPEMAEQRIHHVSQALNLPAERWAREWTPSMLSPSAPPELVHEVETQLADFHPAGQRAILQAFAHQGLRDVLPRIGVPTPLLYGDKDVRSPVSVGEELHARIPGAQLVVIPGVGHMCNLEAPERFSAEVRHFLSLLSHNGRGRLVWPISWRDNIQSLSAFDCRTACGSLPARSCSRTWAAAMGCAPSRWGVARWGGCAFSRGGSGRRGVSPPPTWTRRCSRPPRASALRRRWPTCACCATTSSLPRCHPPASTSSTCGSVGSPRPGDGAGGDGLPAGQARRMGRPGGAGDRLVARALARAVHRPAACADPRSLRARRRGLRRRSAAPGVSSCGGDHASGARRMRRVGAWPPLSAAARAVCDVVASASAGAAPGSRAGSAGGGGQGRAGRPHTLGHDLHAGAGLGSNARSYQLASPRLAYSWWVPVRFQQTAPTFGHAHGDTHDHVL